MVVINFPGGHLMKWEKAKSGGGEQSVTSRQKEGGNLPHESEKDVTLSEEKQVLVQK